MSKKVEEAPRLALTGVKYVLSDMDGTILNSDKRISDRTVQAMRALGERGIKFGLISGRSHLMIAPFWEQINPTLPAVGINGAVVFNELKSRENMLRAIRLDEEEKKTLLSFLLKEKISFMFYQTERFLYYDAFNNNPYFQSVFEIRERYPKHLQWTMTEISTVSEPLLQPGYKILVNHATAPAGAFDRFMLLLAKMKHTYGVTSGGPTLDVIAKTASKGEGLQFLHDAGYIDLNKTLVFGDEANDIPMFKKARYSVAMKNSTALIQKEATFVSAFDHENDGVARFIENFLIAKR